MSFYKKVGGYIQKKRREKFISQKEMAERLSLTQQALSKIENGQRKIFLHEWVNLSKDLKIKDKNLWKLIEKTENKP